jgi:hypothetical protein
MTTDVPLLAQYAIFGQVARRSQEAALIAGLKKPRSTKAASDAFSRLSAISLAPKPTPVRRRLATPKAQLDVCPGMQECVVVIKLKPDSRVGGSGRLGLVPAFAPPV